MTGGAPSGCPTGRCRGRVELTGGLFVDIVWTGSDHRTPVRGRVRRIQLVEQRLEAESAGGLRLVEGSEVLIEVESTPRRFWSNWATSPADEPGVATGVLLELDVDDVPAEKDRFRAGAVAVHGHDVWVMDKSDPVLLHVDTSCTPAAVTEFLVPLTIEPPTRRGLVRSTPTGTAAGSPPSTKCSDAIGPNRTR